MVETASRAILARARARRLAATVAKAAPSKAAPAAPAKALHPTPKPRKAVPAPAPDPTARAVVWVVGPGCDHRLDSVDEAWSARERALLTSGERHPLHGVLEAEMARVRREHGVARGAQQETVAAIALARLQRHHLAIQVDEMVSEGELKWT